MTLSETLSDPVAIAAIALVGLLVLTRLYVGSTLLHIRFTEFWGTARQLFMPLVDQLSKRVVGVKAENRAVEEEYVATVSERPTKVAKELQEATDRWLEVSVLSGLKTDWDGNPEVASLVGYAGDKPFPAAPEWLRDDQIHIFIFRDGDEFRICGHYEANSWRPDRWKDHLFMGETFDRAKGVGIISEWLSETAIEWT